MNIAGLAWPDGERAVPGKMEEAVTSAMIITRSVGRPGTVLQAGGCVGLWPLALASFGWRVITCEPERQNLVCLRKNTASQPLITVVPVALGHAPGRAGLVRPRHGAGMWMVTEGDEVTVTTIDRICADMPIQALVLDVESSELDALAGAERTIARDRPFLWLERRVNGDEIDAWFAAHDYGPVYRSGRWDVYAHPRRLRPDPEGAGRVFGPDPGPADAEGLSRHDGRDLPDQGDLDEPARTW